MRKIERLTPNQEAAIALVREEWRAVGLCTDPIDRDEVTKAIHQAYHDRGAEPPGKIFFASSPIIAIMMGAALKNFPKDDQLRDQLRGQLGGQLGGQLWDQLGGQLGGQLWGQLWDQLRGQLRDQLRDQLGDQLWECCYGQHGAFWLSLYDYAERYLDCSLTPFAGIREVARTSGWWWPYKNVCIVSDRPSALSFDDARRLHCEDGPAIAYRDGYEVWAWHGLRVQPSVIKKEFEASDIKGEHNAEIRRAMVEIMGAESYVRDAGLTIIHQDDWGKLRRSPDDDFSIVEVDNHSLEPDGSRKTYYLMTPPEMTTALEAVAWTFDMSPSDYAQMAASS